MQRDGVSCGVFVCISLHYLCLRKAEQIPKFISTGQIQSYRYYLK